MHLSILARNNAGDAIVDLIDDGSMNDVGYIELRTGNIPNTPQDPITGTLLAVLTFSNPAFGNFTNGSASAFTIASDIVNATGTAGWFRIYDRDAHAIMDGTITATGGGGDIEFDNINFIVGGTVAISGIIANMPA